MPWLVLGDAGRFGLVRLGSALVGGGVRKSFLSGRWGYVVGLCGKQGKEMGLNKAFLKGFSRLR